MFTTQFHYLLAFLALALLWCTLLLARSYDYHANGVAGVIQYVAVVSITLGWMFWTITAVLLG